MKDLSEICIVSVRYSRTEFDRLFKELNPAKVDTILNDRSIFPDTGEKVKLQLVARPASHKVVGTERLADLIETLAYLVKNPYFILQFGKLECRDRYLRSWGQEYSNPRHVVSIDAAQDGSPIIELVYRDGPKKPFNIVVVGTKR